MYPTRVSDLPMAAPTIWFYPADQLPLPTFSIGTRTLEAIVALSSDLFSAGITTGNSALRQLAGEAAGRGQGLGPVPLALQAEVSWTSGQLRKTVGRRCDVWYQTGSALGRNLTKLAETCDRTIEQLEKLLAVHLDGRVSVLLFPDWRSKLFCTATLGGGYASGFRMAMVHEGEWTEAEPTLVHELCHVVAGEQGHPPAAFDEGLARLIGDVSGDLAAVAAGPVAADRATAANLGQGQLWTLKELLAIPGSEWGTPERRPLVSYPEAASFCGYIIRRIGFPGFRDLYRMLKPDDVDVNVRAIEAALGRDLSAIEADWHTYLRGIDQ